MSVYTVKCEESEMSERPLKMPQKTWQPPQAWNLL